jgi:hypothetical protein
MSESRNPPPFDGRADSELIGGNLQRNHGLTGLPTGKSRRGSELAEDVLFLNASRSGNGAQDGVQCADAQRSVIGHSKAVMYWKLGLQDDVTAFLLVCPFQV